MSSTYELKNCTHGARLNSKPDVAQNDPDGFLYSRWANPTNQLAASIISDLEGAVGGSVLFSSGMGAINSTLLTVLKAGSHIVAPLCMYAGTYEWLTSIGANMGVTYTFADATDVEAYRAAIQPNTVALYLETPCNPTLRITDLQAMGALAAERGLEAIVDSTFASPINQRPLSYPGITVVLHSATKYLAGHSDVTAGVVCSANPAFTTRLIHTAKITGGCLSPMDGFLLARGLKTLALRVRAHNANALAVARFLAAHPKVSVVHYPGLESHPDHALAARQMPAGFGGMVSFEAAGGYDAAVRIVENTKLITLAVSLGSVESLIEHPVSLTHNMVPAEERARAGLRDGLIRLSVGIEGAEDLIADLDQALTHA